MLLLNSRSSSSSSISRICRVSNLQRIVQLITSSYLLERRGINVVPEIRKARGTVFGLQVRRAISTRAVYRLARASGEVGGGVAVERRSPTASHVDSGRRRRRETLVVALFTLFRRRRGRRRRATRRTASRGRLVEVQVLDFFLQRGDGGGVAYPHILRL